MDPSWHAMNSTAARAWAGGAGSPPPPRIDRLVLLGHPVAHSLSPRFQNAALAALATQGGTAPGLRYEALDVAPAALDAVLAALVAERAAGTSPCHTRKPSPGAAADSRPWLPASAP
jgi:hypothetical protein